MSLFSFCGRLDMDASSVKKKLGKIKDGGVRRLFRCAEDRTPFPLTENKRTPGQRFRAFLKIIEDLAAFINSSFLPETSTRLCVVRSTKARKRQISPFFDAIVYTATLRLGCNRWLILLDHYTCFFFGSESGKLRNLCIPPRTYSRRARSFTIA